MNDSKILSEIVFNALQDASGGELFVENYITEALTFQDDVITSNSHQLRQGFGLRAFYGDKTLFVNSSDISVDSIKKAAEFIKFNKPKKLNKSSDSLDIKPESERESLYVQKNPVDDNAFPFEKKVKLLQEIYNFTLSKSKNIKKVTVRLSGSFQQVEIIKKDGKCVKDSRPLCRLDVFVVASDGTNFEQGYSGRGGRFLYSELFANWKALANKAVTQAEINLTAFASPAGEMTVVLAGGWPGILLHEAIGHGLEADFNRKGTSVFSDLMNKQIASDVVTVVDDGTIESSRGSINIDDEGTKTLCSTLIKDGKLINYMHDLMSAKIMQQSPTGNGRRESYAHCIMPRMTNTYMLPGKHSADEIISSVKKGIYAVSFGGGQVDITSGKFVFSSSESYLIEDGKITKPIKGATFIGDGSQVLKLISMVGNDLALDSGIGTCGKEGQNVPVGVGQPTIKIDRITVGGTEQ